MEKKRNNPDVFLKVAFVFVLVFGLFMSAMAQQERYVKVKIDVSKQKIGELFKIGIPSEGDYKKGDFFVTEVLESTLPVLTSHGFQYQVIENDMTQYYQKRNKIKNLSPKVDPYCPSLIPNYAKPQHFKHGTMGGYLTYTELQSELDSMHFYFPNLITAKAAIDTFHTVEGRSTYFVKISDNPSSDENEPEVLYLALTHAREPMGMQQLVWFMWYLLENYGTNPEITYLVNNSELYFVPVVNPDGYVYNQTINPDGGGMWRKNRRSNVGGSMGVDLNRNYGFEWGYDDSGSSPDATAETYRGTAGFSETETQTIKWFCEHRSFKLLIDYHTYSNILLYPWGYINQVTPDQSLFQTYAQLLTSDNHFQYGTPGQLLYTTNGGSFDWFYGEQATKGKIYAFSPEAGSPDDGFWPAESRIDVLCNTFATMNLMIARLTNKYATLSHLSANNTETINNTVSFNAQILGLDTTGTFTVSISDIDGVTGAIGAPKNYTNLHLLQLITDSISYSLHTEIPSGTRYRIALNIANGDFFHSDTLSVIYGTPTVDFNEPGNALSQWTSAGDAWITTTSTYVSAPSCITDNNGDYVDNSFKSITTNSAVSIPLESATLLTFMSKWDLEKGYDYVQLTLSEDNGTTWIPLCGKYTVEGSANQLEFQPLYDGTQLSWVQEQIDLTDFAGKQVLFRFTLVSDAGVNADGFYFDDFKVVSVPVISQGIANENAALDFKVYPNPTQDKATIQLNRYDYSTHFQLLNVLGKVVYQQNITDLNTDIDLSGFPKGVYFVRISNAKNQSRTQKLFFQ